jgi:hypothetical protein
MSWFRHNPPKHPPPLKNHAHPHRSSPSTDRAMEQAKQTAAKSQTSK